MKKIFLLGLYACFDGTFRLILHEKLTMTDFLRLGAALDASGKTRKWLSAKMEVSAVTVSAWVTGRKTPSLETLYKIADLLGVDVCSLLVGGRGETVAAPSDVPTLMGGSHFFLLVEVDRQDENKRWEDGGYATLPLVVDRLRSRGMVAPDTDAIVFDGGVAHLRGVNGHDYIVKKLHFTGR